MRPAISHTEGAPERPFVVGEGLSGPSPEGAEAELDPAGSLFLLELPLCAAVPLTSGIWRNAI
ncbi:hypothetical protein DC522_16985 [Microvirga sp. KLBC 81]|nr:hypothetical protein DC522_16985 [Microvirga sp. KLBC 81]